MTSVQNRLVQHAAPDRGRLAVLVFKVVLSYHIPSGVASCFLVPGMEHDAMMHERLILLQA